MLKFKNKKENLSEFQNHVFTSWDDFMQAEIEESKDNFSIDREEDF